VVATYPAAVASRFVWLALATLLACRHSPPSPPALPNEAGTPPTFDAAATRVVTAPSASSASPPAATPPPPATVSKSAYAGRTFPCGAGHCTSGDQMCCTSTLCPAEASCAAIPWDQAGAFAWWRGPGTCDGGQDVRAMCPKLFASCGANRKGRCDPDQSPNVDPKSCADSRDCAGTICCTVGPDENSVCAPPGQCEGNELCRDDSGCKTPGTACVSGLCKSTRARVLCAGRVCSGATPVCQLPDWRIAYAPGKRPPPRCVAYTAERWGSDFYECASVRDCPEGERCVWAQYTGDGGGEWDTSVCRFAATEGISPRTHTCDDDADCADVTAEMSSGRRSTCQSVAVGPTCLPLCDDGEGGTAMIGLPFSLSMSRCGVR
jgi:hypothetical protein